MNLYTTTLEEILDNDLPPTSSLLTLLGLAQELMNGIIVPDLADDDQGRELFNEISDHLTFCVNQLSK